MLTESVISLIVLLVIGIIVFKLVKSVMKTIFIVLSIVTLVIIVTLALIAVDLKDFKENFPTQPSLYLLENDDKIVAGISGAFGQTEKEPVLITNQQLNQANSNFKSNNFEALLEDNYKIFIINQDAFDSSGSVELGQGTLLSKQQVNSLLNSLTPIDDYVDIAVGESASQVQKQAYKESLINQAKLRDDAGFKAFLFAAMIQNQGPLFLIDAFNQNNIKVYKKTITFALLEIIPRSIITKIVKIGG